MDTIHKQNKEDREKTVDFSQIVSDRAAEFAIETKATAKNSSSSEADQLMTVEVVSDEEEDDASEITYSRDSLDSSSSDSDSEGGEDEMSEREED